MLFNGISLGLVLLSLSYLALHRDELSNTRNVASVVVILGWLASGSYWLDGSSAEKQLFVGSLPVVFFALLPGIYWYLTSLVGVKSQSFSDKDVKHLVGIGLALLLSVSIWLMPSKDFERLFFGQAEVLTTWSIFNAAGFGLLTVFWCVLSAAYLIRIILLTKAYHQQLNNVFADHENKKVSWFVLFVSWMLITWTYCLLVLVFEDTFADYFVNETGVSVLLLVLIWIFCLYALRRKPALADIELDINEQYQRSAIDDERLQRIASKVQVAVVAEKAYLDPDINAVKLSDTLGVSPHYLSQTFSQAMDTTFYDFINLARIEAAKIELRSTEKSVLEIATEVGFNTRSSFYNAFKKNTGMTPSEFRKLENSDLS